MDRSVIGGGGSDIPMIEVTDTPPAPPPSNAVVNIACSAVPDGRTIGMAAGLCVLNGVSVSAEVVPDHHTGNASLVVSARMGARGTGADMGVSSGFIWGGGDSVESYKTGGSTTTSYSLPDGVTFSLATNSGWFGSNPASLEFAQATAVSVGYSVGVASLFDGVSVTATNTVYALDLGNFASPGIAIVLGVASGFAGAGDLPGMHCSRRVRTKG